MFVLMKHTLINLNEVRLILKKEDKGIVADLGFNVSVETLFDSEKERDGCYEALLSVLEMEGMLKCLLNSRAV